MRGQAGSFGIDLRHGLIRTWAVTGAAAHDGARLAAFLDRRKGLMGLVVRTIGLPPGPRRIGLANLAHDMGRFV